MKSRRSLPICLGHFDYRPTQHIRVVWASSRYQAMKSILTVAVFYILAFKAFAASPVAPAPAVAKPIDIPLTYWIHESCNNKGVDLAMDEAKDMYKSALIRLQASERNQLRAFEMIFKFHPSQDQARANMIQSRSLIYRSPYFGSSR